MIVKNKWSLGEVALHLPPLSSYFKDVSGATFQRFTFEEKVGEEWCVVLLDDPQFSRELGGLKPFNLYATTGAARTSAGVIAYIIWSVSSRRGHVVDYEHTLNSFDQGTVKLLNTIAQQSHLKVPIVDSSDGQVVGFFELENVFNLGIFAGKMSEIADKIPAANFVTTQKALKAEFSLEELKTSQSR